MIEKIIDRQESVQAVNQLAARLKQMGLKKDLETFAEKKRIDKSDLEAFLTGKHYFLLDGGNTITSYTSARAKILDEMLHLKDANFADVIGNYLLKKCGAVEMEYLILQNHKTLQRCIDYLMEKAWELVDEEFKKQRINTSFAVADDVVINWVEEYYALDDREQMEKKEKEAQEKFLANLLSSDENKKPTGGQKDSRRPKKAKAEGKKESDNKSEKTAEKPDEAQLSLFDVGMSV